MIVDIHSHIIPGIDDGSKDMEMTMEMIKNAIRNGTKKIVATPHYFVEYGEARIYEIKEYVKNINEILKSQEIDIKIYAGQEIYCTERIIEDYIEGNIGTLNDSRYMLIELNMQKLDDSIFDVIYELQVRNIIPIIAHPERYKFIMETPSFINYFIEQGYLFQMNGGSIEGKFGERVRKIAETFLDRNIYNFIGSDAHNNKNRNTGLRNSLNFVNDMNKNIFEDSSQKMLENEAIEFVGEKVRKKKSIIFFLK